MIGLVMCGGKGTRMKSQEEKLLLIYKKPIIQHVISALEQSGRFSRVVCATSHNTPKTRQFVESLGTVTLETSGKGYAADLNEALGKFHEPVFVTSGDLPLLDAEIVREIVQRRHKKEPWTSVLVSKKFLDLVGTKLEYFLIYDNKEYAYTGISIVNPMDISEMNQVKESFIILDDKRIATNLNTKKDYDLLCAT